jgi:oxygen-dependent protoporphyrinogen oxidase
VTVTHCSAGAAKTTTRARACIVATPAHVARRIIGNLPEAVAAALEGIRYGAFVTAGVLTREPGAMAWDRTYATATPGRSFSVMFNMATTLRTAVREPGGSLMLFRGARGAADLLDISDDAIAARFAADLVDAFPELKGLIDQIIVQKWPFGAPFSAVGRARLQPVLAAPIGHIVLAGDYLEFPNMEAAVMTGEEAAASVAARLATTRQDTL